MKLKTTCLLLLASFIKLSHCQKLEFQYGWHFSYGFSSVIEREIIDYQSAKTLTPSHGFDVGFDTKIFLEKGLNFELGLQFKEAHFRIDSLYSYSHGSPGGAPSWSFYYSKKYRNNYIEIPFSIGYQINLNKSKSIKLNNSLGTSFGFRNFISEKIIYEDEIHLPEEDYNKRLSSFSFAKIHIIIDQSHFKNYGGLLFFGPKIEISNIINRFSPLNNHGYERPWNLHFQIGLLF